MRRPSPGGTPVWAVDAPGWLVADEDPAARAVLQQLVGARVGLTESGDGAEALWEAGRLQPSVAVLSATLPVVSAAEVARVLSRHGNGPITIVVAVGAGEAEAAGPVLAAGANRVVSRPYLPRDVEAMVREHLAAVPDHDRLPAVLSVGELELDGPAFVAMAAGRPLRLGLREFELLWLLMQHAGTVVPHRVIRERLWESRGESVSANTITVHIRRLRSHVVGVADILTVRGLGYRLRATPRARSADAEERRR